MPVGVLGGGIVVGVDEAQTVAFASGLSLSLSLPWTRRQRSESRLNHCCSQGHVGIVGAESSLFARSKAWVLKSPRLED
jgi:hypothetical protein